MKQLIFFIVLLFAVLLNTKIAPSLGFEKVSTAAFLPLILYLGYKWLTQKIHFDKEAIFVIVLALIMFILKWAVGQDYLKEALMLMIFPMIASICFENLSKNECKLLFRVIVVFYIANCGLSIVEWALNYNFFADPEWAERNQSNDFFRSTAFIGHPLSNAQVVAVFMTFIAAYNFKSKSFQILLFFLGYASFFCFNVRGATLVVSVLVVPYFIWKINRTTRKDRKWIIKFSVICLLAGLIYTVTQTSFGGRLMNMEIMDSSSQSRLNVFQFYNHYQSNDELLWGNSYLYEYMMEKLGAGGVENGVITMLLDYGIIITIPMLFLLFLFQFRKLSVYPNFEKWLLLAVFFIIGTMNPNLARPIQWIMWIFAYYAFRPKTLHPQIRQLRIINQKSKI